MSTHTTINIHSAKPRVTGYGDSVWLDLPLIGSDPTLTVSAFLDPADAIALGEKLIEDGHKAQAAREQAPVVPPPADVPAPPVAIVEADIPF